MSQDDPGRDPFEELAAEFTELHRQGENPAAEDFAARHPDLAEQILDLFPTIAQMERAKAYRTSGTVSASGVASGGSGKAAFDDGVPSVLGDYRLLRELGRGGMGIVYEAMQESLGRLVALKVLPRYHLNEARQLERFRREARTAAQLHHTNIVPVFGVGEHDGFRYYVMQRIFGVGLDRVIAHLRSPTANASRSDTVDLSAVVQQLLQEEAQIASAPTLDTVQEDTAQEDTAREDAAREDAAREDAGAAPSAPTSDRNASTVQPAPAEPLPSGTYFKALARVGAQVAGGLAHAHEQGVLHRDIKPANLLLDEQGVVWVTDFGLASVADQSQLSRTGDIVGTLRYMGPERFNGEADGRSDVYSLGVTLWECIALKTPFEASGQSALIENIRLGRLPRVRALRPDVPRDLETILLKATSRAPAHRYRSAEDFEQDLEAFVEDRPIQARRASAPERVVRWGRRNPALAAVTAMALALLVSVAAVATVGYVRVRSANEQVTRALEKVTRNKANAERALDRIFGRFAPVSLPGTSQLGTLIQDSDEGDSGEEVSPPVLAAPALSEEVAELLEDLVEYYDDLARSEDSDRRLDAKVADARLRVGKIRFRLGQFPEAAEAFQQALADHVELQSAAEVQARILNELGLVQLARGDPPGAREAHRAALERLRTVSDSGGAEARFEEARTHYLLAKRLRPGEGWSAPPPERRPPGRRNDGRRNDGRRNDGRRNEPPRNPDGRGPGDRGPPDGGPPEGGPSEGGPRGGDPNRRGAADRGSERGRRGGRRRDGPRREEHLQWANQLLEPLVAAAPEDPRYRHLLARCYLEVSGRGGPRREAFGGEGAEVALSMLHELEDEYPNEPVYRSDLLDAYAGFRHHDLPREELAEARKRLERALVYGERLVRGYPNELKYVSALTHVHFKLASVIERMARDGVAADATADLARQHYVRAVTLQRGLVERFPDGMTFRVWLALVRQQFGFFLGRNEESAKATLELQASVDELEQFLVGREEEVGACGVLARSHRWLAEAYTKAEAKDLAATAREKGDRYRDALHRLHRGDRKRNRREAVD